MGLKAKNANRTNILLEYNGEYVLLFQKAVAAWWIGKRNESIDLFWHLFKNVEMTTEYANACINNLKNIGAWEHIRCNTENNFAQIMQDLFALNVNKNAVEPFYLEIGANHPTYNNNTYLLEKNGWKGISIEISEEHKDVFSKERKNPILYKDATKIDYNDLLKDREIVDYLQVDCDPALVSLSILKSMPFDKCIFKCITFEHDCYDVGNTVRDSSRDFLRSKGYIMVADNVGTTVNMPFEDWWVHSSVASKVPIFVDGKTKTPDKYISLFNE